MKHFFTILLSVLSTNLFAQNIGIGNTNPLQKLHISSGASTSTSNAIGTTGVTKVTPTVRIDGLNQTLNGLNSGEIHDVHVDAQGDLVLAKSAEIIYDAIPFTQVDLSVPANTSNIAALGTVNFTLDRAATIAISYTIESSVYSTCGTTIKTDGSWNIIHTYFQVNGGIRAYGYAHSGYNNDANFTATVGSQLNTSTTFVALPAGNHSLNFSGYIYSATSQSCIQFNQAPAASYVQILAIY